MLSQPPLAPSTTVHWLHTTCWCYCRYFRHCFLFSIQQLSVDSTTDQLVLSTILQYSNSWQNVYICISLVKITAIWLGGIDHQAAAQPLNCSYHTAMQFYPALSHNRVICSILIIKNISADGGTRAGFIILLMEIRKLRSYSQSFWIWRWFSGFLRWISLSSKSFIKRPR